MDNPAYILKCRDLVELYLGARLVSALQRKLQNLTGTPALVLTQDPRRVRYELVLTEVTGGAPVLIQLSTTNSFPAAAVEQFAVPAGGSTVLVRDYRTDFDNVTLPVFAQVVAGLGGTAAVSTRETFLTPLPADES